MNTETATRYAAGYMAFAALVSSLGCRAQVTTPDQQGPATTQEARYATLVPVPQPNTLFSLKPYTERNQKSRDISLWVENTSEETLVFPYDWGAEVFMWSTADQDWILIPNHAEYSVSDDIVVEPSSGPYAFIVSALPELPEGMLIPDTIRITVRGHITRNGTFADEVSSFIDIDPRE